MNPLKYLSLLLAATVPGQTDVDPGFVSLSGSAALTIPTYTYARVVDDFSGVVAFDGTDLVFDAGPFAPINTLMTLPATPPKFASFVIPITSRRVLFGESTTGNIWDVPLTTGAPRLVATIPGNYAAVLYGPSLAIVSAGANNAQLFTLDLSSGQTTLFADIPTFSGSVTRDDAGNLFYGTAEGFPALSRLLHFPAATVFGALNRRVLTAQDAVEIANDLPSTLSMQWIPGGGSGGDIWFTDFAVPSVQRVRDVFGTARRETVLDYSDPSVPWNPSSIQWIAGGATPDLRTFDSYQPQGVGHMVVFELDYGTGVSQTREIQPRRPVQSGPIPTPAGPVQFALEGPPNGIAVSIVGMPPIGFEAGFQVPGFRPPLLIDVGLLHTFNTFLTPLDPSGLGTLQLSIPRQMPPITVGMQTMVLENGPSASSGADLGTSVAAQITFP